MVRKTLWYVPVLSGPGERRGEESSMASERDYASWHHRFPGEVLVAKFCRSGSEMEEQVRVNRLNA